MLDCLIIGGGPGGLVAATYLKRFHRDVAIVDEGRSRAALIPKSHNIPGFPRGISGSRMLGRMRDHAKKMRVQVHADRIVSLHRSGDVFHAHGDDGAWRARTIVLATGVVDRTPPLHGLRRAIRRGIVRLCPVCDAYEATGQRIAIYGEDYEDLRKHACFLRTFSPHVLIVVDGKREMNSRRIVSHGIDLKESPHAISFGLRSCRIAGPHRSVEVGVLYVALGADAQSSLAGMLGAATDDSGALLVDAHMETRVSGLYAIGDVVSGLNQISSAAGQAAIAATAIHNRLSSNWMPGA